MKEIRTGQNSYTGNSATIKPKNVDYGSTFYEQDTDINYYYAKDRTWKVAGGGGAPSPSGDNIVEIDNIAVNKKGKTDLATIEIGDLIMGELPVGSGRFIVADVMALPYTDDANLEIYSINNK